MGCTSSEICPTQGDFIYYQQDYFAKENIVFHDCNKQLGTTDCNNSYDWIQTTKEYNNPENYDFIWYCANAIYRAFMPSGISGFKRSASQRYSTFLGNQHEIAVNLTWFFEDCPNDSWVNVTRFDALPKPICPDCQTQ